MTPAHRHTLVAAVDVSNGTLRVALFFAAVIPVVTLPARSKILRQKIMIFAIAAERAPKNQDCKNAVCIFFSKQVSLDDFRLRRAIFSIIYLDICMPVFDATQTTRLHQHCCDIVFF